MMKRLAWVVAALALLLGGVGRVQADILDDFNRPDSNTLGPNWTERAGQIGVTGMRAENVGAAQSPTLATFNGQTSNAVQIDVFAGNGLSYTAAVLGFRDLDDNLYIKVQHQAAAGFDTIGFYFGLNGQNNNAWSGASFGNLTSPFSSARMLVTLEGSTLTVQLDTHFNGTFDQVYTAGDVPVGLLGDGIGIGEFGDATIGNFGTPSPVPEPSGLALAGVGLVGMLGYIWRRLRGS
jgi:hypothetical protein